MAMTAQETAVLIGAIVGLFTALQAWLTSQAVTHGTTIKEHADKLDGLMDTRITVAAESAIAADHAARAEPPLAPPDPVKAARLATLRAELASLEATVH